MGHDLAGEQFHRAHHLGVWNAAEIEIADKIVEALGLQRLDLGNALIGRADDGAVLGEVLIARGRLGALVAEVIDAMPHFAAAGKSPAPLDHVQHPIEGRAGVANRFFFRFRDVEIARKWNARQRHVEASLRRHVSEAMAQGNGVRGVEHHADNQGMPGGDDEFQGRWGARRRDVHGRRLLRGRGDEGNLVELKILAFKRIIGLGPQIFHNADRFPKASLALVLVDLVAIVLVTGAAAP